MCNIILKKKNIRLINNWFFYEYITINSSEGKRFMYYDDGRSSNFSMDTFSYSCLRLESLFEAACKIALLDNKMVSEVFVISILEEDIPGLKFTKIFLFLMRSKLVNFTAEEDLDTVFRVLKGFLCDLNFSLYLDILLLSKYKENVEKKEESDSTVRFIKKIDEIETLEDMFLYIFISPINNTKRGLFKLMHEVRIDYYNFNFPSTMPELSKLKYPKEYDKHLELYNKKLKKLINQIVWIQSAKKKKGV